ncbi:MAG: hypothetical protein Q4B96_05440, partial [Bacillota bacterium]|nr:hypothetical protein [Bacillota bacterium]
MNDKATGCSASAQQAAELIRIPFVRTVFLPAGSPAISAVEQIRYDIRLPRLHAADNVIYAGGELDLLIDYRIFNAAAGLLLGESAAPAQYWQALLTLPFELLHHGELCCVEQWSMSLAEPIWYMISPTALELELELLLTRTRPAPMPEPEMEAGKAPAEQEAAATAPITAMEPSRSAARHGAWEMVSLAPPPESAAPQEASSEPPQ